VQGFFRFPERRHDPTVHCIITVSVLTAVFQATMDAPSLSFSTCYFASGRRAKYCNQHVCMFVCLFTCLSVRTLVLKHAQNFRYITAVAVAWSSCDGSAIFVYFRFCGWRHVFI